MDIRIGAGEAWDGVVDRAVTMGLSGIECLSLVPGTAGAAPVQNINAYGQHIQNTLIELSAYDTSSGEVVDLSREDCGFGYRSSRFNRADKGRFIILSITLRLSRALTPPPYYKDIADYLEQKGTQEPTVAELRQAVMAIRHRKLPDPTLEATAGSFFYNPIITSEEFTVFQSSYPQIDQPGEGYTQRPYWTMPDGTVKLSAGWLIENSGLRGWHDPETGMAVSEKQALTLINKNATSASDLFRFRDSIVSTVRDQWGITLEQEPETIG
jgi:UDP-N-acetylmuramate dehydrogenase